MVVESAIGVVTDKKLEQKPRETSEASMAAIKGEFRSDDRGRSKPKRRLGKGSILSKHQRR